MRRGALPRSPHEKNKDKAKSLQQYVAKEVARLTGLPCGRDCPIESRQMGQAGVDIRLDAEARKQFPFSCECKKAEDWDLQAAINQAYQNRYPETHWVVFLSKARFKPVVVLLKFDFDKICSQSSYCWGPGQTIEKRRRFDLQSLVEEVCQASKALKKPDDWVIYVTEKYKGPATGYPLPVAILSAKKFFDLIEACPGGCYKYVPPYVPKKRGRRG